MKRKDEQAKGNALWKKVMTVKETADWNRMTMRMSKGSQDGPTTMNDDGQDPLGDTQDIDGGAQDLSVGARVLTESEAGTGRIETMAAVRNRHRSTGRRKTDGEANDSREIRIKDHIGAPVGSLTAVRDHPLGLVHQIRDIAPIESVEDGAGHDLLIPLHL